MGKKGTFFRGKEFNLETQVLRIRSEYLIFTTAIPHPTFTLMQKLTHQKTSQVLSLTPPPLSRGGCDALKIQKNTRARPFGLRSQQQGPEKGLEHGLRKMSLFCCEVYILRATAMPSGSGSKKVKLNRQRVGGSKTLPSLRYGAAWTEAHGCCVYATGGVQVAHTQRCAHTERAFAYVACCYCNIFATTLLRIC